MIDNLLDLVTKMKGHIEKALTLFRAGKLSDPQEERKSFTHCIGMVRGLLSMMQQHFTEMDAKGRIKIHLAPLEPAREELERQAKMIEELPESASIAERFEALAQRWKRETRFCSSTAKLVNHPAYQEIISLGRGVVPLILDELRTDPRHWFPALQAITGENPVAPEDRGILGKMTTAWMEWAHAHGF